MFRVESSPLRLQHMKHIARIGTFLLFTGTALDAGFLYEISESEASPSVSLVTISGWDNSEALPENLIIPDTLTDPEDPAREIPVQHIADYAFQGASMVSVEFGSNVSRIGFAAFKDCALLETLILNEGLENVQSEAFQECKKLSTLTLPDSLQNLSSKAFYRCTQLQTLTIGKGLISLESEVFSGCSNLITVQFPADSKIHSIGQSSFYSCTELSALSLPLSLRYINQNAFYNCRNLTGIVFNEGLLEIHTSAFRNCSSLDEISLPSTLQSLGDQAFASCTGLSTIADLGMSQVIGFYDKPDLGERIFENCRSLSGTVRIPDTMRIIPDKMFYNCSQMTGIEIGAGVTEIGPSAFYGSGLTSIIIPNNVITLGKAVLRNCDSLSQITLPNSISELPEEFLYDADSLQTISLPSSLEKIHKSCFALSTLSAITIPQSVTRIEETAFDGCMQLATVNFQSNSQLIYIGNFVFRNCDSLETIDLPEGLTLMNQGLFYQCDLLNSVSLPSTLSEIQQNAFYGCKNLTTISLPATVTLIGSNAFKDCWNLSNFTFGPSASEDFSESAITALGTSVFSNCYSLEEIKLPENLRSIGNSTFRMFPNNSNGLESTLNKITLPDTVSSIGSYAFSGCRNLSQCNLSSSLLSIGSTSFENCIALVSLIIPDTLTSILPNAFKGCIGLRYVEFLGDNPGEFNGVLTAFPSLNSELLPVIFIDPASSGWSEKWSGRYTKAKSAISLIAQIHEDLEAPQNTITELYSFDAPQTATLNPAPTAGYLFDDWVNESGVVLTDQNPLIAQYGTSAASISEPEIYVISATYVQDNADNDTDDLSNYAEVAIYLTDPNKSDTNEDNIPDGEAVTFWDSVFDYIKNNGVATNHTDKERFTREMLNKSILPSASSGYSELRMGDTVINKNQNGNFDISLTLEHSEDLSNWQELSESTFEVSPVESKSFYRVVVD